MSNENSYVPKSTATMYSFTMPCDPNERNRQQVDQACRMRIDDLNNQASSYNKALDEEYKIDRTSRTETRHHCNLTYEVIVALENIRVNLYGGNAKDAMMIGYNFCSLQMNPSWKEEKA